MKLGSPHQWVRLVESFLSAHSNLSQPFRSRGKSIFSVSVSDGQSSCSHPVVLRLPCSFSSRQPQLASCASASSLVQFWLLILPLDLNLTIDPGPRPIVTTFRNSSLLQTNSTTRLRWTISSRSCESRHPHRAAQKKGGGATGDASRSAHDRVSSCFARLGDQGCVLITITPL